MYMASDPACAQQLLIPHPLEVLSPARAGFSGREADARARYEVIGTVTPSKLFLGECPGPALLWPSGQVLSGLR